MPRVRTKDHDLPEHMYLKHGAYYFVDAARKWHHLGRDRTLARRAVERRLSAHARKRGKPDEYGQQFLYVLGIRDKSSPIKIGISFQVDKRIKDLQTSHPEVLELRGCLGVPRSRARTLERAAHKWLDAHRLSGEWFAVEFSHQFWIDLIQKVILAPEVPIVFAEKPTE